MKAFGRWILILVLMIAACRSKDGDLTFFSTEDDLALGSRMAEQIESDPANFPLMQPADHPQLYEILDGMLGEILRSQHILHRDELAWELRIIDNDTMANAFCTPGGYIYVYTGLIKNVETIDELAGVMAHEVAHGDLRHSTDQMTKTYGIRVLLSLILEGDVELLANIGANLLSLTFSRSDETEADVYAVRYLSDTRYDPRGFASFFDRLSKSGGDLGMMQFLSTHPDPGNRVGKIHAEWERLGSPEGRDNRKEFERLKRAVLQ
jgi:predicted Zn-dependent protease